MTAKGKGGVPQGKEKGAGPDRGSKKNKSLQNGVEMTLKEMLRGGGTGAGYSMICLWVSRGDKGD